MIADSDLGVVSHLALLSQLINLGRARSHRVILSVIVLIAAVVVEHDGAIGDGLRRSGMGLPWLHHPLVCALLQVRLVIDGAVFSLLWSHSYATMLSMRVLLCLQCLTIIVVSKDYSIIEYLIDQ